MGFLDHIRQRLALRARQAPHPPECRGVARCRERPVADPSQHDRRPGRDRVRRTLIRAERRSQPRPPASGLPPDGCAHRVGAGRQSRRCVEGPREVVEEGEEADFLGLSSGLRDHLEKNPLPRRGARARRHSRPASWRPITPSCRLHIARAWNSMTAFKAGASFVTIPQRIASSIRKYSWRMRFPIPLICAQGSVGNSASQSSGMRRTASEIVLDRAGRGAAGDRVAPKGVERHSRGHVVQNCDLRQAIPNGDCRVLWHHATLTASRSMLVFIIG